MRDVKWISQGLMITGSVGFGALIILPVLLIYSAKTKEEVLKLGVFSFTLYLIVGLISQSFNLLIFVALLSSLLFTRTKSRILLITIGIAGVLAAFVPSNLPYLFVVAWIVGVVVYAIGSGGSMIDILKRSGRAKSNTQDSSLTILEIAEEQLRKKR